MAATNATGSRRSWDRSSCWRCALIVGIPGVSYLTAMDLLARQHVSTFAAVLVVLAWNVIMLLVLEGPIVAYALGPQSTAKAVTGLKNWLTRDQSRIAYWCTLIVGVPSSRSASFTS